MQDQTNQQKIEDSSFPKHFQVNYKTYYSFKNLDPVVILLFILFIIIYFIAVIYKLN